MLTEEEIDRITGWHMKPADAWAQRSVQMAAFRAIERAVLEQAAIAAWFFYADVCKKNLLNPHHHGEWIASDAIRALLPKEPNNAE